MKTLTKVLAAIIFVMSASVASGQTLRIFTQDSIPLNPAAPMLGQFPPPPIYFRWMIEIAQCEHLALPPLAEFKKSRFFFVNADDFQVEKDPRFFFAVTQSDSLGHADIYISIVKYLDFRIVMHEFLHVLLHYNFPDGRYNGSDKSHPSQYYGTCGIKPD